MAGKSSNLGASASSSSSTKMVKPQQEKRKQLATRAEQAKKQRPFQLINFPARTRGSGTATPVVVPPLHRGASNNMATPAFPFPMPGVNGAAPLWSTAAMLGAASRAAALTLSSLPATASANGPAAAPFVIAPAPGLQPTPAGAAASNAAAALALAAGASSATCVSPPLVLAYAGAGAGGQLVPLPLQFVGYHSTCHTSAVGLPPPAVGIPLAAALGKIENAALGRMISSLMPVCNPPLRQGQHHQSKTGPPPPWWPTGSEDWWATELLEHLDSVAALSSAPVPVPFAPSYGLKKPQKVAVLVAIVKHLAPDFARIASAVRHSGKLSISETDLWHSALNNERAKYTRPVFILLPQQQQQQGGVGGGGGGVSTDPGAAGSVFAVHSGNAGASDGCELQVANLPAGGSVSAPADGSRGEVVAAAELVVEKELRSDSDGDGDGDGVGVGVGVGVVSATDAPAGDDGLDQPVNNFPAGDGSTDKQGAAVAAAPTTGHVRQEVEGGPVPEMTMQPPEQDGGVPGDEVAAAAAEDEDEDEQVHPVVAPNPNAVAAIEEAPEDRHWWWCDNDELLNRMFGESESFGDDVWY